MRRNNEKEEIKETWERRGVKGEEKNGRKRRRQAWKGKD